MGAPALYPVTMGKPDVLPLTFAGTAEGAGFALGLAGLLHNTESRLEGGQTGNRRPYFRRVHLQSLQYVRDAGNHFLGTRGGHGLDPVSQQSRLDHNVRKRTQKTCSMVCQDQIVGLRITGTGPKAPRTPAPPIGAAPESFRAALALTIHRCRIPDARGVSPTS